MDRTVLSLPTPLEVVLGTAILPTVLVREERVSVPVSVVRGTLCVAISVPAFRFGRRNDIHSAMTSPIMIIMVVISKPVR